LNGRNKTFQELIKLDKKFQPIFEKIKIETAYYKSKIKEKTSGDYISRENYIRKGTFFVMKLMDYFIDICEAANKVAPLVNTAAKSAKVATKIKETSPVFNASANVTKVGVSGFQISMV
jgi:hypothetical protein